MRKHILGFLIATIIVGLLSACSSKNASQSGSSQLSSTEGEVSGEITVASWNLAADSLTETAKKFMEKYLKNMDVYSRTKNSTSLGNYLEKYRPNTSKTQ